MNISHKDLAEYLKHARRERFKTLHEVHIEIDDIFSQYTEASYTTDDLKNLQRDVENTLNATITNELCVHAHSTALLMLQYLSQHHDLQADIPKLENKQDLTRIAEFEKSLFASAPVSPSVIPSFPVSPVKIEDDAADLSTEVELYKIEIGKLKGKIKALEQELRLRLEDSNPVIKLKMFLKEKNETIEKMKGLLEQFENF